MEIGFKKVRKSLEQAETIKLKKKNVKIVVYKKL